MIRSDSNRFPRFVGALTAIVLIGGSAAFAASIGVTSSKLTVFTKAGPPASADTRAPLLQTLEMFDDGPDGFIDRVVATFDEVLAPYTAGNAPWTLAFVPSARTLATTDGVTINGMTATLSLIGGTTTMDTASGAFTVKLDATDSGIRDAAGNKSSFAATAVADKAKPLAKSVSIDKSQGLGRNETDPNGGRPSRADSVIVSFTEKLSPPSICPTTWTGTGNQSLNAGASVKIKNETTVQATSDDQLTVVSSAPSCDGAFKFGTLALGTAGYVTADVSFGTGIDTVVAWDAVNALLTITLGTVSGTDSTVDQNTTPFTAIYTPSTSMTDVAGNPTTGSVSKTSAHF